MKERKFSFKEYDVSHVYEWLIMYWQSQNDEGMKGRFGHCGQCTKLGLRLEKFLGDKQAKSVRRIVAKNWH